MARSRIQLLVGACAGLMAGAALAGANIERGATLYAARCGACHSIDEHGAGPRHRGLLGRRAGSEPGYDYSTALSASRIVWSPALLDKWLANPSQLVPGNKMVVQLANEPDDRADLIAYLIVATRKSGAGMPRDQRPANVQ
jgi:cytochrome c